MSPYVLLAIAAVFLFLFLIVLVIIDVLIKSAIEWLVKGYIAHRHFNLIDRELCECRREAILNGLVHRDWHLPDPVTVTWVQADSALQVVSPGGFVGSVTAETVLTQRFARHPALADLFRALGLVEKQGLGVDRMYREMVVLGHRPPVIIEDPGPRVRTRLVGGKPVIPVMALTTCIEPAVRRKDVRVALVVDTLLREPFTTPQRMALVLQRTPSEAEEALDTAADCRVHARPLLARYKDVWMLSPAALNVVERSGPRAKLRRRGVLPYRWPDDPLDVVLPWLAMHDRITSGDHALLTGLTQPGALKQLDRLVAEGFLIRGTGRGRNAHFLLGPVLNREDIGVGSSPPRQLGTGAHTVRTEPQP